MGDGLFEAFIYLLAALVAVPLAKRLGLGAVIGYLFAGAVIGPYALNLAGGAADVMHFAEFGVVMMLFVIGLELRPAILWQMRRPILGPGGLQVVGTALAIGFVASRFGLPWKSARRVAEIFREPDEASVRDMARLEDVDDAYVSIARKHVENLERALQSDAEMQPDPSAQDQAAALRSTI